MATVNEVVAGLTQVDANILARYATGEPLDSIAANTGQRAKEVERVVQYVATFNAQYARTLALAWQRANSPGRIGTAPAAESSTSARLREVEGQLSAANGRIRDLACEVEQLGAQLLHAEQYARDLQDNGDVMPVDGVLIDQDAEHCPPCGWTGREPHDHPTIPVRVLMIRTQGAPTA